MAKQDRLDEKLKNLNQTRLKYHSELKNIKKLNYEGNLSNKKYQKYEQRYNFKLKKILEKINSLDDKNFE